VAGRRHDITQKYPKVTIWGTLLLPEKNRIPGWISSFGVGYNFAKKKNLETVIDMGK